MEHGSKPGRNPYEAAGVDTEKGDALADWLAKDESKGFKHPHGLGKLTSGIGGFAGLFEINFQSMKKPQLVASTDGVGTKLLLGLNQNQIDHLGQDLVAMCANDLYTIGATPLFFLDYYATGSLSEDQFKRVLTSIKSACKTCGMALMGGETAEMPGLYEKGHFDLAGFVVGVVDEESRLGAHRTKDGDFLIAWESSGFHSNGYSLIRKWLSEYPKLATPELIQKLMAPTKLYPEVVTLAQEFKADLHAMANITGGGISGNLPRVIADDLVCEISLQELPILPWMKDFILGAKSSLEEIEPVFNLGAGMVAVVEKNVAERFIQSSSALGLKPKKIGQVVRGKGPASVCYT